MSKLWNFVLLAVLNRNWRKQQYFFNIYRRRGKVARIVWKKQTNKQTPAGCRFLESGKQIAKQRKKERESELIRLFLEMAAHFIALSFSMFRVDGVWRSVWLFFPAKREKFCAVYRRLHAFINWLPFANDWKIYDGIYDSKLANCFQRSYVYMQ